MNKNLKFLIKLSIGILILIIIYVKIGPHKIVKNLVRISPTALLMIFFLDFLKILIGSLNLNILLRKISDKISYLKTIKYYLYSWSIGLFLPSKIGEFSIGYFLKRENILFEKAIAIQILDKIITISILIPIAIIGISLYISKEMAFYLLLLIIVFIFIIILSSKLTINFIPKIFKNYIKKINITKETLLEIKRNGKKTIIANIMLTILNIVVIAFITKTIFSDLDVDISILNIIMVNSITLLSGLVPISLNGLGIKQGVGTYIYSILGVEPTIALVNYTLIILLNYGLATIICLKLLIKK